MLLMYHVCLYQLSLCTQNHKAIYKHHISPSIVMVWKSMVSCMPYYFVWKQVIIVHCFLKISMNKFDTLVSNWTNNHHKKKLYWILMRIMSVFYNSHLVLSISVKFLRTTSKCLFVHCITFICLFCVLLRA